MVESLKSQRQHSAFQTADWFFTTFISYILLYGLSTECMKVFRLYQYMTRKTCHILKVYHFMIKLLQNINQRS